MHEGSDHGAAPRGGLARRRRLLAAGGLIGLTIVAVGVAYVVMTQRQPDADPDAAVTQAMERLRTASTVPAEILMENGVPEAVRARVRVDGSTPVERALDYLRDYRDLYRLAGSASGLGVRGVVSLGEGAAEAVTLYQSYRGIPVYGAEIVIPIAGAEALGSVGALRPDVAVATVPSVTPEAAEDAARDGDPTLIPAARSQLVVFDPSLLGIAAAADGAAHLAWRVVLGGARQEEVFVDAASGEVLLRMSQGQDASGIDVKTNDNLLSTYGIGCVYAGREPDAGDADAAAAAAHFATTYDWYFDLLGRISYNGVGAPIDAIVHSRFEDADGEEVVNAHWVPVCAAFEFSTGMAVDDVVAHEFTHAVTQHRSGLKYFGASGALNESFSDVMAFFQTGDPLIGEASAKGVLRSVADPTVGDQPSHASDFEIPPPDATLTYPDHGGVHSNSGIPNLIAYRIARGDGYVGIGDERAAKLYYTALALHSPTSDFDQHLFAVVLAAGILGFSPREVCEISSIFSGSGIDSVGDECAGVDSDADLDGVDDAIDNCLGQPNPLQADQDGDNAGDKCDADRDGDGLADSGPSGVKDNCPMVANPLQEDFNANGVGAACDPSEDGDIDNDHVGDAVDNCPHDFNSRPQPDVARDGEGDACDPDLDGDGISTNDDNCPDVANADQADGDGDRLGDACDPCASVADSGIAWSTIDYFTDSGEFVTDVRPLIADSDGDGLGDACDDDVRGSGDASVRNQGGEGVALRPLADASGTEVVVAGGASDQVAIFIGLCALVCEPSPPAEVCVDLSVQGRDPGTSAYVRDDLGTAVGRAGPDDAIRFNPSGGRSYELVFALLGETAGDSVTIVTGRCGTSPTVPGASPPPAASPTVIVPPAAEQITRSDATTGTSTTSRLWSISRIRHRPTGRTPKASERRRSPTAASTSVTCR